MAHEELKMQLARAQPRGGRSETKLNILRCRLLSIYAIELESNSFRRSTVAAAATMMRIVMQRVYVATLKPRKLSSSVVDHLFRIAHMQHYIFISAAHALIIADLRSSENTFNSL